MLAYHNQHVIYLYRIKSLEGLRNNNHVLLNDISEVYLLDEATIEVRIKNDIEFELDDAVHINEHIQEVGESQKLFQLTIFGNRTVPSKEARSYSISEFGSRFKMAEAIVVESLSQKMVFNFMINVEKPSVRTKLFTSIQEARDWLNSLRG